MASLRLTEKQAADLGYIKQQKQSGSWGKPLKTIVEKRVILVPKMSYKQDIPQWLMFLVGFLVGFILAIVRI